MPSHAPYMNACFSLSYLISYYQVIRWSQRCRRFLPPPLTRLMRTCRSRVRQRGQNKPMQCQVACREDGLLFFDSAAELCQHDMLGWGDGTSVQEFEPTAPSDDSDPRGKRPKTLLCHDMSGGYLDYDRLGGAALDPECHPYTLMHWWYIDVFVYFSHHFVSPPPLTWIRQSHRHGVPALGTLITEFDNGEEVCRELFATAERADELARKLVELCKKYSFDGWLVNIENAIDKDNLPHLTNFLRKLREGLKAEVGPHSMVVWYDSVTCDGELKWQNELNKLNLAWLNLTDAIFLNYTWKVGQDQHAQSDDQVLFPSLAQPQPNGKDISMD